VRSRLRADGATIDQLADWLDLGRTQLKAKLNGHTRMSLQEILVWKWRLGDREAIGVPPLEDMLDARPAHARAARWPVPRAPGPSATEVPPPEA